MALLLVASGSEWPAAGDTEAMFVRLPTAAGDTDDTTVYVTPVPGGSPTVSLKAPVPLAEHVAPASGTHVQVLELTPTGSGSATDAAKATDGPAFCTRTV